MWGSVDTEIQADKILIPQTWASSKDTWKWEAFKVDGILVLRVWKEKQCEKDAVEKKTNLACGITVSQDDRFFTLPEVFLRYMIQTHQNTVTIMGMGKHFEIWPEGDYQRNLNESEPLLSELCKALKYEKFEF